MHDFGVYIRLRMMGFMVYRVKQRIWKGFFFQLWSKILKVLGYCWRIGYGKVEKKIMELEGVEEVEG